MPRVLCALVAALLTLLLAPPARAQLAPPPPVALAPPDPLTPARVRAVLARYAAEERTGRDATLAVAVYAGAATLAAASLMLAARPDAGGGPALAIPFFVAGALEIGTAPLWRLPGAIERGAVSPPPLAPPPPLRPLRRGRRARVEHPLAPWVRDLTTLRRVSGAFLIGTSAVAAAFAVALSIGGVVSAVNGPVLPAGVYISLPLFGLAAYAIAASATLVRDDLARDAQRELRTRPVARPHPAL